ncbi:hypothetical protein DL96DRAFT_214088 [Flagelloscypha sp. PMI_526]|nr:hypothetical protein DL96DRAFT_214088 [Flagelloscypha sp. PMI_526]
MLRNVVEGFESIGRISIEKHLLATPSNTHVKAAFRTIDIAVSDKSWAGIKAKVEKNVQDVFDDCEGMIFDGLPSEKSELYTTRQVFFAAISAVIVTFKGKDGVVGSLNSLLIEIHKSTRDLRGLPPPEGQFDLVIGQLFRRIITVIAYATPTLRFRFPSLSRSGYNVVNQTDVQEQLHHIRWLVDDLQWRFGEFSAVLNQKLPPSFANQHPWPRSDFLRQTKERVVEVHSLPRGNGEAKRFQTAVGRLIEITDGLVIRLEEFEERIVENTYHEVDRLLQATKSTKSSLEMASNILAEVSRCLSRFSHALDTPKNKVALARSIVVTLGILQTLSSAIPSHAVHLTVVSAISKISVQNIEEKLSLNDEGIARLVSDLMLLTVCLDSGENVKGQAFTSMWEEALRRYNSLTSTDLGALANASGAETIEDLQRAVDQNQYASIRAQARGAEMRQALQPVLGFLHSFTGAIGEAGAFGGFFPSKAIAGSVMAVFDASQNIRNSIDMVFDLFKDLSAFLTRVKIHMKSEQNIVPDLKLMLTEMLCQFLLVMGTAYSIVRRGRLNRIVNYLARSPDVIADQVREFKRIYCNLDRLLLSLIFEGTYSLGSQHRASSLCYVSSQGGPPASTNVLLSQDRDQTLVTPPASKNPGSNFIVETGGENIGGKVLELLSPAPPPKRITSDPVVSTFRYCCTPNFTRFTPNSTNAASRRTV